MIVTELLMNRQKGNLLVTIMMLLLRWWYQFPCEISLIEHGGTGERPIRAENVKLKLWLETILSAQQRSALRSGSGKKKKSRDNLWSTVVMHLLFILCFYLILLLCIHIIISSLHGNSVVTRKWLNFLRPWKRSPEIDTIDCHFTDWWGKRLWNGRILFNFCITIKFIEPTYWY